MKRILKEWIVKWLLIGTAKDLLTLYICLILAYYLRIILFHVLNWTSGWG